MNATIRAAGLLCTLLSVAPAQDAPRVLHPGRVLGAEGAPVAGAEVTLVTAEGFGFGLVGDVVRVTADDGGRFRARLLPTRRYRAWAMTPAAGDQPASVSEMVELTYPMTTVRFDDPQPACTRVKIDGLAPWRELGEVRVEALFSGVAAVVAPQVLTDTDELELPALPFEYAMLELLFFVDGELVHAAEDALGEELSLPAPQLVRGLATDAAGQPLAGVAIERVVTRYSRTPGPFPVGRMVRRFRVATTGDDGRAEWYMAGDSDPFGESRRPKATFAAGKRGYRDAIAGFTVVAFAGGQVLDVDAEDRTLPFRLQAAEPVRGVLRGFGPDARVLTGGYMDLVHGKRTYEQSNDLREVVVGADGAVHLAPPASSVQDWRVLLTDVVPPLAEDDPFRRAATPRPMWLAGERFATSFTLDRAEVVALRLQVLDQTGGPAMGAFVACLSLASDEEDPRAVPIRADASGRVVLPVLPGKWFVLAVHDGHWSKRELDVKPACDVVELALERMPVMRLRAVDADGEPVAGARLGGNGATWTSAGSRAEIILTEFGSEISDWVGSSVRSDANGHFDLPFAPTDDLNLEASLRCGKRKSHNFGLVESEERIDVTIR